jgi:hypothetical protein
MCYELDPACLDTRIRSWNYVIEKRTVNAAEMLLTLPRASSTETVSTVSEPPSNTFVPE